MRSAKADQSPQESVESLVDQRLPCAGQSYVERLGVLYLEQIRCTIVTELFMREMGIRQFYETVGGSSYASVRRHFLKLVEYGWLRKVRVADIDGRGRPEALYRSTELAVIDTETWRTLPFSIRDAFTVQLLEEMGVRLGEALEHKTADARADRVATFKILELDELGWCKAYDAIERCFHALLQEQTDAKIRLESSGEQPLLMVVNLAAFEAPGPSLKGSRPAFVLPKADVLLSALPWPERVGRVFSDQLDLAIVDELNRATLTPAQLRAALGGTDTRGFLRRCKRLVKLGWTVNTGVQTGGPLHGASVYQFRAAAPNLSEADIFGRIPARARAGRTWDAFERFIETSIAAVDRGTFNRRFDRHLTMSPLLVDEIGWTQVTKALRAFEATLLHLEDHDAIRRRSRKSPGFRAAFLWSGFEAPLREARR